MARTLVTVAAVAALGILAILVGFLIPIPQGDEGQPPRDTLPPIRYIDGVKRSSVGASLTIWTNNGTRNNTAPVLGGLFFEDISQSGDGGLYAELLRNRAFQGSGVHMGSIPQIPYSSIVNSENPLIPFAPVLDGWSGIGDVSLSLDLLHPLSEALQVSLKVDVRLGATGRVGIRNDGWWGIPVSPQTYQASFYAQPDGVRFNWTISEFEVSLQSALVSNKWCSSKIPINGRLEPYDYNYFNTSIKCDVTAPNINNTFAITFDGSEAAGQTLYFDLISLFPETYKGRRNGLRKDLAEHLEAVKPKFLRFPGGNNLEGYSVQRRWKWWKTIGDLKDRPGRPGDWTYFNTDGLGLLEYLEWCEDMGIEPLLAVYAGLSLNVHNYDYGNSSSANEWPMRAMPQILQEALEELEYCMGNIYSYWGAKRAMHGHPEPFNITMVEIGNEDFFSHNYAERAKFMYNGLKERYPNITYIFSAFNESSEFKVHIPPGAIWDAHSYAPAGYFIKTFDRYDNFPDPIGVGLMEYHASFVGVSGVYNSHPRMGAAVSEAVVAIAGERNPNVYKLSTFAPLLQNLNAYRGTPYDLLFTADPSQTVLSSSYFQQKLFNSYPGKQTLPVTERKGGLNPLFWVATVEGEDEGAGKVYLKVVNAGNSTQPLDVEVDVPLASVNGTILAAREEGDLFAFNYFGDHGIVLREIEGLEGFGEDESIPGKFDWKMPPFSVAVLQLNLASQASLKWLSLEENPKDTKTSSSSGEETAGGDEL